MDQTFFKRAVSNSLISMLCAADRYFVFMLFQVSMLIRWLAIQIKLALPFIRNAYILMFAIELEVKAF